MDHFCFFMSSVSHVFAFVHRFHVVTCSLGSCWWCLLYFVTRVRLAPWNWFKPSSKIFLLTLPRRYFFCGLFLFFLPSASHAFAFVHWFHMVTCSLGSCWWCLSILLLSCGILGKVWYLIVSFSVLCHLSYFDIMRGNSSIAKFCQYS